MAWSNADLTSSEQSLFSNDKPLLSHNVITPSVVSSADWDADGSGTPNAGATDGPGVWAYDGRTALKTKPNAAGTTWYYIVVFSASVEFDFAAIIGHNFNELTTPSVTLEIADNSAFSSNLQEIADFSISSKRCIEYTLKHSGSTAQRYSNVDYARIKITTGASETPEFGELYLGARAQLRFSANRPFVQNGISSVTEWSDAQSGAATAYTRAKGRRILERNFTITNDSVGNFVNVIGTWWGDVGFGANTFIFCEEPSSSPNNSWLVRLAEPKLGFTRTSPFHGVMSHRYIEQGPPWVATE